MPRSRRSTDLLTGERGSASLEFLTVGMILLVPLVYLVLAVAAIQAAALGVILIVLCAVSLYLVNRIAGARVGGLFG